MEEEITLEKAKTSNHAALSLFTDPNLWFKHAIRYFICNMAKNLKVFYQVLSA